MLATREGDGVCPPVGADICRQRAMGDEASRTVMRVAMLRRDQPIELADEPIEVSRKGGCCIKRQRRAVEPMHRLENKLDRDSAVKQLRRGGTKLRRFEVVIDCQGDMRAVSELPRDTTRNRRLRLARREAARHHSWLPVTSRPSASRALAQAAVARASPLMRSTMARTPLARCADKCWASCSFPNTSSALVVRIS